MAKNAKSGSGKRGNRRRMAAWIAAAGVVILLSVAFLATPATGEGNWDAADFATAGVLLASTGFAFALAVAKSGDATYRAAVAVALAASVMLFWLNAAAGIIGTETDGANVMFGGVLAIGILGSFAAHFRPLGMARAMFSTASALVLVAIFALVTGQGSTHPAWPLDLLALIGFFAVLYVGSGILFRKAARAARKPRAP